MKFIFNLITVTSLRLRLLTLALVILLLVLGGVAISQLNRELLPPLELPQTIILAQASGMTSEQVLEVLTKRIEPEIAAIDEIINIESNTTGSFGVFMTAFNDFGQDQEAIQASIQEALDNVWLPSRRIEAPEGEDPQAFAQRLIAEMPPEPLIFIAEADSNFFFELSPEIWETLPVETVEVALAYLATQEDVEEPGASALERLVEKEVVPQLRAIEEVANVTIDGGQALPGEEANFTVEEGAIQEETRSLLLRLSPEVWEVAAPRIDGLGELDDSAVETLSAVAFEIPEEAPALPESWQQDHFENASDLIEVQTLATSVGGVFNNFYDTGRIVGALGQTNDLTPETVEQYLAIDPTLAQYFEAEQLVAMPQDVFDMLPQEFLANLDGFSRDELAAAALAQSITGETIEREPVDLPSQWQIQQPDIITFSFADIPLATFSVSSTADVVAVEATADDADEADAAEDTAPAEDAEQVQTEQSQEELPEGPALPPIFLLIGQPFGITLDTADDLINVTLPEETAEQFGIDSLSAGQLLNFVVAPPEAPDGQAAPAAPAFAPDPSLLVGGLSADVISFIVENDPNFLNELDPQVFNFFNDDVLALPEVSPPLADAWDVLASQPQFADNPLTTAGDVVRIGDGEASSVLNAINANVPSEFEGYEVRLFDSLTPGVIRYFVQEEAAFYENLDENVLTKLNAEVLAELPEDFVSGLEADLADTLTAIAEGEQNTAFAALQELYTSNVPAGDPDAPELNPEWAFLEPGYGIELDSADDFFRFPDGYQYEDAAALINSIFESPQGANFAPVLLGGFPIAAVEYILERDASVLNGLEAQALREFSDEAIALLPEALQQRAVEGGEVFEPEDWITRTNGQPSLFVTVFKDAEANTVSSYADVEDIMLSISEANDDIEIGVIFEQSSFIEDSINGVAREGSLGAIFAIIIILVFLSSGSWNRGGRRLVGAIMIAAFALGLVGLVALGLDAAGNDWGQAFADADVVLRVLLIFGIVSGLVIAIWPGNLPDPAWRATIVIAVSIPLSIFTSFVLMRWLSPAMNSLVSPLAEDSAFFEFVLRLFPEELTLNIMTLSGLTVAVGRVVDDSIVVLENIVRQLQAGGNKRDAVISGTRDVSAAIFTATFIAIIVFLPLGLTGGIIGAFFLPFGLAVTYALIGSFLVAITVVPVMAYLTIDPDDLPEDKDMKLADYYRPVLRWSLSRRRILGPIGTRGIVVILAILSAIFGFFLLGQRPAAFLPNFGEPQISVIAELPAGTSIIETNEGIVQLENFIQESVPEEQISAIQTTVGGLGASFDSLLGGGGVTENAASMTIGLDVSSSELDEWAQTIRTEAQEIFGEENVTVSAASVADGGFGGFALIVSGPEEAITEFDPIVIETLEGIEGITNVTSNLTDAGESDGPPTIIRINQESALSYSAELETENTIGVTQIAIQEIQQLDSLPDGVTVSEGFQSEIQTQGFNSLPIAMGIALIIVIFILLVTFGSLVYWLALIMSIIVAPVGAAIALTLTDRVLGISALIGLLMLLGLVITNAVVLIDRVQSNRSERGMNLYDALIEAGGRRLRPILMTSLATIIALMPLAIGLSEGAIIAAELGTVVIGGVFSSTVLTLIVVPVVFSLLNPLHRLLSFGPNKEEEGGPSPSVDSDKVRASTD